MSDSKHEIWADIPGFANFQVSNFGRVKSKAKQWTIGNGAIRISPEHEVNYSVCFGGGASGAYRKEHNKGYLRVVLKQDGKTLTALVHRLVAEAFINNPDNKPCVDHLDRDTYNNTVENLRWTTTLENNENRGGRYGR